MAQLLRQTLRHNVDGLIKIMTMVLGVKIRPTHGEMNLDHEGMLERAFIIVPESNMRSD